MSNTPFMNIRQASSYSGLSQHFIREGCKKGTVPHIKVGNKYMVDVEGLVAYARSQAAEMWEGVC